MAYYKGGDFDLTELHKILLEIGLDIQKALEAEGIPFFFAGGTMIGCARGGKFLAWDDDMDIGFEKNYQQDVERALKKHLGDKYIIECPNTVTNHKQFFRVIKPNTCMIRNTKDRFYKGIDIEMFPMTDVPEKGFKKTVFLKLMRIFLFINWAEQRSPWVPIVKIVNMFKKMFFMVFDKLVEGEEHPNMAAMNELFFGEIIPKEIFGTPKKRIFEGVDLYFPEKFDEYLTLKYGSDFMTPPPESKRRPDYLVMDTEHGPDEFMDCAWKLYYGMDD